MRHKVLIREMRAEEAPCLKTFLYEAIFIPEGAVPPPRSILNEPELQVYIADFGNQKGDVAYIALLDDQIIGAAWARIMKDYGHIDDETPSCAISLKKEVRGQGIGTSLMKHLLARLQQMGYHQVSLSVQKDNDALHVYKKLGFLILDEIEQEYRMVKRLDVSD